MLLIDGSAGEGGGQILRSSLALSMVSGEAVRLTRVRGRRPRPGLRAQHVAAVRAAVEVSGGTCTGADLGSTELSFEPGPVSGGRYAVDVGTAGSTTLVLQTVLPALLAAPAASTVAIVGGTHNPMAPPLEFIERAYLLLLQRMGAGVQLRLDRYGFAPSGGGRITATVQPCERLEPLDLQRRGRVRRRRATAIVGRLPRHIAQRELETVVRKAGWPKRSGRVVEVADCAGPGNCLLLEVVCEHVTEVFAAFGRVRVPAERVAAEAVKACQRWLQADVAIGPHLADQLLLPMALGAGGSFTTLPPTPHFTTHVELIRRFLDVDVAAREQAPDRWLVRVGDSV